MTENKSYLKIWSEYLNTALTVVASLAKCTVWISYYSWVSNMVSSRKLNSCIFINIWWTLLPYLLFQDSSLIKSQSEVVGFFSFLLQNKHDTFQHYYNSLGPKLAIAFSSFVGMLKINEWLAKKRSKYNGYEIVEAIHWRGL
jgi:hypothetical protein